MKIRNLLLCTILVLLLLSSYAMAYGNITVSSAPTGAAILLNGTSTGLTTPATIENIPAGSHTVLLQLAGYQDYSQTVTVSDDATSPVSATLTAAVTGPTITSISPTTATNGGWQTVEITGTGFSSATVYLYMNGQTNISGSVSGTDSATSLNRNFNLNGVAVGTWTLFILNSGGGTASTTFTVNNATAATVTSISPTSATTNTTVAVTIAGTGFTPASAKIRLYRSGNYIGGSVNSGGTSTQLTGSFNLDQATPATYEVCVLTDGTDANKKCGPSFIVYATASAANGSLYFTSTPAGAVVLVDSVNKGNTPFTLYNVTPGSYVVKMQRASYLEWSERVTVTAGNQTTVTGKLTPVDTSTTQTTAPTVVITTATLPPTTVKSTRTVPTPWSAATAAPTESPAGVGVVIGAIALGCIALRRK